MRIKKATWFHEIGSTHPIGIVIGENDAGEDVAYIGTGNGFDPVEDINKISRGGAKFPIEAAKIIFGM